MKRHTLSTYRLINNIISGSKSATDLITQLQQFKDWEQLVYHGSAHLLLPTIYKHLKQKNLLHCLPEDLNTYLQEIHHINHGRNLEILKQIKALHALLSTANIQHVFLKGAAFLIMGSDTGSLERMVGDIDLLVPSAQLQEAYQLLQINGYNQHIGFNYEVKNFRHLDRQISDSYIAAVELHDALLISAKNELLKAQEILDTAVVCNGFPIPDAQHMGLHSVLAYQINDRGYYYKQLSLKTWNDVMQLQLLQNPVFISTLNKSKYGSLFVAWAAVLQYKNSLINHTLWQRYQANYLKCKLAVPVYARIVYRIKKAWHYLTHRLELWLTNPSYRKHILKNKFIKRLH
jgi:hypothetical protein